MTKPLNQPCGMCPFLKGSPFDDSMSRERAQEIATTLENDGYFPCHRTTDCTDHKGASTWCAGAVGTMQNQTTADSNLSIRMAVFLKLCHSPESIDRTNLHGSLKTWVENTKPA